MSNYHTQKAFKQRMTDRLHNPQSVGTPKVFYHIACMNSWQEVVLEQLRLLAHVGLTEVTCAILGQPHEVDIVRTMADQLRITLQIGDTDTNLSLCELPTLRLVHSWCVENTKGHVIYHHTKGVHSKTHHWRKVMAREVIANWERNARLLDYYDSVGVNWCDSTKNNIYYGWYRGTFWAARNDWIANLPQPDVYKQYDTTSTWWGTKWCYRFFCETWIGAEPYHHFCSIHNNLGCIETKDCWKFPTYVPGFEYR